MRISTRTPSVPPRRPLSVLGLVGVLALTACSAAGEDDSGPGPSAISPDTLITCDDNGDCAEPGSVRWSLPLEDVYQVARAPDEASRIGLPGQWLDQQLPDPGAVVADGVLYYHRDVLVTAVDTASGTELWTEGFDGPVSEVEAVGGTLLVRTLEPGEEGGRIHLFALEGDGARPLEPDPVETALPEDALFARPVAANETHFLLREGAARDSDTAARFFLVDAATGEVEWTRSEHAETGEHNLADDNTLYLHRFSDTDSEDPSRVVGVADGRVVSEFDLPEGVAWFQGIWATGTGQVLFDARRCAPGEDGCGEGRITAADARSGEVLWAVEEAGSIMSLTPDGSGTSVHVELRSGYQTLDARTGEVLAEGEDATGETEALLSAFGARRPDPADALPPELLSEETLKEGEDAVARLEEALDMIPAELVGPGSDGVVLDGLAAAPRHLTSYPAEGGEVVGAFLGCAPGGVRPPSWSAGSPEAVCAEPRLFAVDYGV